jgi:hypothetical protein
VKSKTVRDLRKHADVIMKIPSGEQHLGHLQAVLSVAILDVARWIETFETARQKQREDGGG